MRKKGRGKGDRTQMQMQRKRERDHIPAENQHWKLDTRFISWSDCDFRNSFKYWKYLALFNLRRDQRFERVL